MTKKKYILALAVTGLLITGCSDKEEAPDIEKEEIVVESENQDQTDLSSESDLTIEVEEEHVEESVNVTTEEIDSEKEDEIKEVKEEDKKEEEKDDLNEDLTAKSIYLSFFAGLNEEDTEKIESVFKNTEMVNNYKRTFEEFDLTNEIIKEKLISKENNVYSYEITVLSTSKTESDQYSDNEAVYQIDVDSSKNEITYFEIKETNLLD